MLLVGVLPLLVAWKAPENSCDFVAKPHHPDPHKLMQEYLRRDFRGDFTSANAWFDSAIMCPGHVPGWDAATIVASYSIRDSRIDRDTAHLTVDYLQLGTTWSDGGVKIDPGKRTIRFKLEKTPFGWRLENHFNNWHISLPSALGTSKIKPNDRKRLEATAARLQY
ncbi:MAG TPA: hypothetical protein V6D00_11820 [Pantanalinema sp.]